MPTFHPPGSRKGNKTFIVRGYVNGKQREITTKATNKTRARQEWEAYARELTALQAQAPDVPATFGQAAQHYLDARPDLFKDDRKRVEKLQTHFLADPLADVTNDTIRAAALEICPDVKPQTRNRYVIRPAASVMHYAAQKQWCPWLKVELFEEEDPVRVYTLPEDLEPLVKRAEGELKVLLRTLQVQGWRITETISLERSKVDWERSRMLRFVAKSRKWREAAISDDVLRLWRLLPARADGRLFSYRDRHAVYAAIDALAPNFHYRPHQSRRGFATALRDAGLSKDAIADAGQWEDTRSLDAYIRDDPERVRPAFDIIKKRTV